MCSIRLHYVRNFPWCTGSRGTRRGNLFRGEYCAINKKEINKGRSRRGGTSWQFFLSFFFFFRIQPCSRSPGDREVVIVPARRNSAGRFSNVKIVGRNARALEELRRGKWNTPVAARFVRGFRGFEPEEREEDAMPGSVRQTGRDVRRMWVERFIAP